MRVFVLVFPLRGFHLGVIGLGWLLGMENGGKWFFWVVWLGRETGGRFSWAQEFSSWSHHLGWFCFLPNLGENVWERGGLIGKLPIFPTCIWRFFNYYLFLILTKIKKKIKLLIFLMRINSYKLHFLSSHFSSQPNNFFSHSFTFPSS